MRWLLKPQTNLGHNIGSTDKSADICPEDINFIEDDVEVVYALH